MRFERQPLLSRTPPARPAQGFVQRKAAGDRLEEEADRIAEAVGSGPASAAPSAADSRLDPETRTFMERRLGHDFRSVRIHADGEAVSEARSLGALAFTSGRDVYFGEGQYAPGTDTGRRLIAHELTHVVQQRTGAAAGIQRAPDTCKDDKGNARDFDKEVVQNVKDSEADPSKLPELYLGLKRARACASMDEAAFLKLFTTAPTLYDPKTRKALSKAKSTATDLEIAWAESQKPFAGYRMSGYDTANRFSTKGTLGTLGATPAPSHLPWKDFAADNSKAQPAFAESNILVFSGHQYAQYKLPGVWDTGTPGTVMDVRGITGPLPNVKLLISTSCATLCKEAYDVWKGIFPNAFFLGAARSTPLDGAKLANTFVKNLPQDLLFDPGAPGLASAVAAWKSAVQSTQGADIEGGVLDIAGGTVEVWKGKAGWVTRKADAVDNKCKVKGDYSSSVPDPRAAVPATP